VYGTYLNAAVAFYVGGRAGEFTSQRRVDYIIALGSLVCVSYLPDLISETLPVFKPTTLTAASDPDNNSPQATHSLRHHG